MTIFETIIIQLNRYLVDTFKFFFFNLLIIIFWNMEMIIIKIKVDGKIQENYNFDFNYNIFMITKEISIEPWDLNTILSILISIILHE